MCRLLAAVVTVMLVGATLIGCAGTSLTAVRPFEQSLNPYQAVYFTAEPMVTEDITQELSDLEQLVALSLNEQAIFKSAKLGPCTENCDHALLVTATITDINKVSSSARFFGGAFAGKASMTADVVFADAGRGDTLAVYTVKGKSGGTGLSGGTESAVNRTAKAIVELIQANY